MGRHTTPRDINATERGKQALQLRKQGYTLDEIATQCGFADKSGAWRSIKRELDRIVAPDVADLRKMEEMRLDDMLKASYPKALKGDSWAVSRVIDISRRRSEITGMDIKPEDILANQNYVKKVILTHEESSTGGQDAHTNNS